MIGVGTGRCGSRFITAELRKLGVPITHEESITWGRSVIPPGHEWSAAGPAFPELLEGHRVWLQVRNPADCVASLFEFGVFNLPRFEMFRQVLGVMGFTFSDSPWMACCEYWVQWNELCLTMCDRWWRVEDVDAEFVSWLASELMCERLVCGGVTVPVGAGRGPGVSPELPEFVTGFAGGFGYA